MKSMKSVLFCTAIAAITATIISLVQTDWWVIRALDLVREPALYVFAALALTSAIFGQSLRVWSAGLFAIAACINAWCIWPYSRFAAPDLELVGTAGDERCFSALSANVKMENREFAGVIDQLDAYDPDLIFLTETNQAWIDALKPVLSRYPNVSTHPQDDTFGKVFASRLATIDTDFIEQPGEDTPTFYALLKASDTGTVRFTGLHPKAPLPGQNTQERDQSIQRAADKAGTAVTGAIVMGDFNDVPWSRTTSDFRERGEWKDPRIGRGTYPTFPSFLLPIGWPLDQVMVKGDVQVRMLKVLAGSGSDHRALFAEFCLPQAIRMIEP
ncbi:hypothetical protein FGU71_01370 [Erythrobacter insulae]|uniref:Endonuclease/exonuclease/phosphatase domain-containing protein n=1 Tax=Erythrobacter insulae TaxID=2584124 RepID=A0A547P923_9SPHN|nr:endonuclease/exonuclease/phosphatase family protein [Erythrobacter insulae]TRD10648.1 hypothetical protein FGU71_01370 [Erythrobacter insulae]